MSKNLPRGKLSEQAFDEALRQSDVLAGVLKSFVETDTLLFVSPDEAGKEVCGCLERLVGEVNALAGTMYVITDGLDVSDINVAQNARFGAYLETFMPEKTAFVYLAALELRSVMLGILLAERKISVEEAFSAAFYEELFEQKRWGVLEETAHRQREIKNKLFELERIGYERGVFEN